MPTRRTFLQLFTFGAAATVLRPSLIAQPATPFGDLPAKLAALERTGGGRLGVAVLDTGSGSIAGHRLAERFPMCSTFKVLLVSAVLREVDVGREPLDRLLPVPAKPLVPHSPLTEPHAGGTMTIGDLCHAALVESDNTATNLLLGSLGGPVAITRFARSIGDTVTRIDRTEPSLNEAVPGDSRDTTSPAAMAGDLRRLLLGDVLQAGSRARLKNWMVENRYGLDRLRANLPADWGAADKTGSNGETTSNDIAVYWPPDRAPLVVTAYLTECPGSDAHRAAVLASVGRLVVGAVRAG